MLIIFRILGNPWKFKNPAPMVEVEPNRNGRSDRTSGRIVTIGIFVNIDRLLEEVVRKKPISSFSSSK